MTPIEAVARGGLLLLLLGAPCRPALAQDGGEETIFDPDNPDAVQPEAESDDGEETIFDPDNPDVGQGGDDGGGEETIDHGAEAVAIEPVPSIGGLGGGYFRGRWRVVGAADLAMDVADEDVYELHNQLDLRVRQPFGEVSSAVLEARFAHALLVEHDEGGRGLLPGPLDDTENVRGLYGASLEDAYVSTRFGSLLLRVGQQRIVWGSVDITRPADVVNPMDLTAPLAVGGETTGFSPTYPVLAAKADWVTEYGTVGAVLLPFFHPHRFSLLSTDFSLARPSSPLLERQPALGLLDRIVDPTLHERVEAALAGTELPDELPQNISAGVRLSTHALSMDLAVGYLYGWDRIPVVVIDPDLQELLRLVAEDGQVLEDFDLTGFFGRHPEVFTLQGRLADKARAGADLLSVTYERWHVLTLDGATYLGPVGVRFDVAFSPERTVPTEDFASARRPALNSALGLSYESDTGALAVILEGFLLHIFDPPPEGVLLLGEDFWGLASGVRVDLEPSLDLPLSLSLGGVATGDGDTILSLGSTWRFDGDSRLLLGLQLLSPPPGGGDDLTIGDLYGNNDQVFLGFEQGL